MHYHNSFLKCLDIGLRCLFTSVSSEWTIASQDRCPLAKWHASFGLKHGRQLIKAYEHVLCIYAIRHNPLCSMQKYFLLPRLLWVLGSISAWTIMSITSVSRLETSKYCRVLFTNIHSEVIQFLPSIDNTSHIQTIHRHVLLSCQLSQRLLLVPGTEQGPTSGTGKGWYPFLVQSYSAGNRNSFSGLLSEANHKWSIYPVNHRVGFSIYVQFLSQCHKKKCANTF